MSLDRLEPLTERAHSAFAWVISNRAYLVVALAILAVLILV